MTSIDTSNIYIRQRPEQFGGGDVFAVVLTRKQLELVFGMLGAFNPPENFEADDQTSAVYSALLRQAETVGVDTNPYHAFGIPVPAEIEQILNLITTLKGLQARQANEATTVEGEYTSAADVADVPKQA